MMPCPTFTTARVNVQRERRVGKRRRRAFSSSGTCMRRGRGEETRPVRIHVTSPKVYVNHAPSCTDSHLCFRHYLPWVSPTSSSHCSLAQDEASDVLSESSLISGCISAFSSKLSLPSTCCAIDSFQVPDERGAIARKSIVSEGFLYRCKGRQMWPNTWQTMPPALK